MGTPTTLLPALPAGQNVRHFLVSREAFASKSERMPNIVENNPAKPEGQEWWATCIARVAEHGDRDSFLALFDYFAPRIKSYLQRQGADESLAEDLSQEAMLSLWRKANLYNAQKAAASTWLFRIARNLMIDRLRKERGIAYSSDEEHPEPAVADNAGELAEAEAVRRALAHLPEQHVTVVYKSYFEGMSHGEIARDTGIPLGTVKSNLRLALRSLRAHLGIEPQ